MEVFQLKAITELDDDRYIYHIAIPFGSSQYIVQYWVERVNAAGHTINLTCAHRRTAKRTAKSECKARLTLKAKSPIWPFIQPGKRLTNRVKYEFKGGREEIMDINNYELQMHNHSQKCLR